MKHELKILPAYFEAVISGEKTFEIRDNSDRGFQKGDIVTLTECTNGSMTTATGRQVTREITYVTNYGQTDGMVVFGMKVSDEELAGLRLSLDAAMQEIDDLNKDIEKQYLQQVKSGKAAIQACADHIEAAWEHGFIDRPEQDMLDVTTAIRNFAESYQGAGS